MNNKLYITNLASNTTKIELWNLFSRVGRIVSLQLETDPQSPAGNRYSFIGMKNAETTQAAIDQINNHVLHYRRMKIVHSQDLANEAAGSTSSRP